MEKTSIDLNIFKDLFGSTSDPSLKISNEGLVLNSLPSSPVGHDVHQYLEYAIPVQLLGLVAEKGPHNRDRPS